MNIKEKLTDLFGSIGSVLYIVLSLMVSIFPIVMIGLPFWIDAILIGIMLLFPSSSLVLWVMGLFGAITGPQDVFAIIYYILFVIIFIPQIVNIVAMFTRK